MPHAPLPRGCLPRGGTASRTAMEPGAEGKWCHHGQQLHPLWVLSRGTCQSEAAHHGTALGRDGRKARTSVWWRRLHPPAQLCSQRASW